MPNETKKSAEYETIVGVQFGIFSPEEIERRSVVEITSYATYDGNEPKIGGLFDPRMGVLDNGKTCRSCGQTNHNCPGHFGHYKLTRPVYFIQFFPMLMSILRCVCIRCSKLLIDKELHKSVLHKRKEPRWKDVLSLCSSIKRCGDETEDGCGAIQPKKYIREGIARIVAQYEDTKQNLEVEFVHSLLRRIIDDDVEFMGFSRFWCRPDWMVCTVLPIPPPQVRPSVIQDNNQRSEDDMTHKLFEIIKTDKSLLQKIENNAPRDVINDWTDVLQYHIATLVDNQIPGVAPSAQRSGRPLKSIQQRLGSKEGRIRYNIQGKRVEFSARSVITPDPNISTGEIGIPIEIASNLTFPERVTPYNREKLYKLIQNGADKYPGAKTLVRADGRMISLKHVDTREIVLYSGDTVNRHLLDGDIVLFNRQPTLHRMSMMGHRVKVLPYKTFRLNVLATKPYNADFDGDEMNIHVPQSYETAIELAEIAALKQNIITPRHAKPIIGIFQDSLVGSYLLTNPNIRILKREFMNLMMWNKRFDGSIPLPKHQQLYDGQQVMGTVLPSINIEMGNKAYEPEKDKTTSSNYVKIVEGELKQGVLDDDIYMKPGKGIVHVTYNDHGPDETIQLLDSIQNIVEGFLVSNGFSVGISDLVADSTTKAKIEEIIQNKKKAVEQIIMQVHTNLFENNTGKTNYQEFEDQVFGILNKATDEAGKTGKKSLSSNNRLVSMVASGSKGNTTNIAQMIACLGQQAIEGKRIPYGLVDRTLPHYKKYDDGAESRGFIESSFARGLTPQEFFFHAMSGREGLIDTAVKSVSGDTEIIIVENNIAKHVTIGGWIDMHLKTNDENIQHIEKNNMEYLELKTHAIIPTTDENGNVSWGEIKAVTRHDPGNRLYRIKTLGDREVVVTEAQSLLIWNSEKRQFLPKATTEVTTEDYVPVMIKLPTPPLNTDLFMSDYCKLNAVNIGNDVKLVNDVFMDKIIEITSISPENYPKMYDLTVPSTFNFGLANGLQVRDTADTGYIQRQLVKAMEDLVVQYDGTVRDANMNIVQFHYGEDGFGATKIESQGISLAKMTLGDINTEFGMDKVIWESVLDRGIERGNDTSTIKQYLDNVIGDRKILVENVFQGRTLDTNAVQCAVNISRLVLNAITRANVSDTTDLTPMYIIQKINEMDQSLSYNKIWGALLRFHLAPHKLIVKNKLRKIDFDKLCQSIIIYQLKSWVQPGEQVGIVAAQSIGEPATQMTLNVFHYAGVASSSNVTRGVPRLRELLKVTKNPKASSLTIYMKPEFRNIKEKARELVQDLELTLLRNITNKIAIIWDPTDLNSVVAEDRKLIEFYRMYESSVKFEETQQGSDDTTEPFKSRWIIRLELNRELMFNKNITMSEVVFVIKNQYPETDIIYSDYNSQNLVMRIRMTEVKKSEGSTSSKIDDLTALKKFQTEILNGIVIHGIPGIKAVTFKKDEQKVQLSPIRGNYEAITQYVLDTDGSNYLDVMNHPLVDGTKLYTTNVYDVLDILGIEAARNIILSEILALFEGVGVNYRHLGLLCDVITHTGKLMSIDRYGINRNDIGPLVKASFEETEKIILKAAIFGEIDPVISVSSNIMMGQPFRGGTAFSQILIDEPMLAELKEAGVSTLEQLEEEKEGDIREFTGDEGYDPCMISKNNVHLADIQEEMILEEGDIDVVII